MKERASINSQSASCRREERNSTTRRRYKVILLAIDCHAVFYMVSRQIENTPPQPPQRLTPQEFLEFLAKQLAMAEKVYTCYEAGCFGYSLHRKIEAMGGTNFVIVPQNWDERNKKVKTDRVDTAAMISRLDRYVAGNKKALGVVTVPSEADELARSRVRQRDQFKSDRKRWANQGKSLLLYYGLHVSWSWWQEKNYPAIEARVRREKLEHADAILQMLVEYRDLARTVSARLDALTREQIQTQKDRAARYRIKGMGPLSTAQIDTEAGDWNRFKNRRQVASYTGLCPGVSGSGGKFTALSVTKHGNRRLRAALVEVAWLLFRYQPDYPPVRRWLKVLAGKQRPAKKKAIVAVARRLAVDLWRIRTGRATPQSLGLRLMEAT